MKDLKDQEGNFAGGEKVKQPSPQDGTQPLLSLSFFACFQFCLIFSSILPFSFFQEGISILQDALSADRCAEVT